MCTLFPCTMKTEEIKVRVEPITKATLNQLAQQECLDLSDIVRRALRDFIAAKIQKAAYGETAH